MKSTHICMLFSLITLSISSANAQPFEIFHLAKINVPNIPIAQANTAVAGSKMENTLLTPYLNRHGTVNRIHRTITNPIQRHVYNTGSVRDWLKGR